MSPKKLVLCAVIIGLYTAVCYAGERKSFTWSPKPYDKTKTYMVQNFRVAYNLASPDLPQYLESNGVMFSYESGLMVNASRRFGFGVGGWIALEDLRSRIGAGPRARYWISPTSALDFSVGPIVAELEDLASYPVRDLGLFGTATYSFHENLLFTIHFESVEFLDSTSLFYLAPDFPLGSRKSYFYAGVGTGGEYGLATAGASFLVLLVAVSIAVSSGNFGLGG